MIPHLAELPSEIYDGILAHVPRGERQKTTLSLTRVIPRSPVPLRHLFECIRLRSAESVVQLYCRLRGHLKEPCWVREFSLETWIVDADVVVNLVALLQQLTTMTLFVGPNFTPEHMEEMLEEPRGTLNYISLRFRPYVQKATYYQFLKGAYFDSALVVLSRWPTVKSLTVSIVQDPLDPEIACRHRFAQPLVFFRFDSINVLACSPYFRSLMNLRLRIPSRQVAPFIYSSPSSVPGLRVLDLSTCDIRLADVEALLARFRQLTHLIIDRCNIMRGEAQESDWANLGKVCALASVKAAREREKKLKTWLEAHTARDSIDLELQAAIPEAEAATTRRVRPGRRGLATATISLRDLPMKTTVVAANTVVPKIRIVPSTPTLCSLSTTSALYDCRYGAIRTQFKKGWDEGLAQLSAIHSRLYQSWRNGVRMMRIVGEQGVEEGFEGLEDIKREDVFLSGDESRNIRRVPVLCLAGTICDSVQHVDGCGHVTTSCVWQDDI